MSTSKTFLAALLVALVAVGGIAIADTKTFKDAVKEDDLLKAKPYLDIRKAKAGHTNEGLLLHSVTMRGKIRPKKGREKPLILINTKGSRTSSPEYIVVGKRVLRLRGDEVTRTGRSQLSSFTRVWTYRFDPASIGNPASYGWAALTAKGNTSDLAPTRRYAQHKLGGAAR